MTKTLKTLGTLFLGVLMVLALGANTSKAETFNDLTVKGDARFQYPIYADGGVIQFGGGDLRILDFNQGSSRIYDQGDLYVVTDDNLYFNFSNQSSEAMATFDSRMTVNNNFNALFPIYATGNEIVFNGTGVALKTADNTPRIYRNNDTLRLMAPNMYIDVPGTVTVENDLTVSGDLAVTGSQTYIGNTTFSGTLTVNDTSSAAFWNKGETTLASDVWAEDTFYVQNGSGGNAISFDYDGTDLTIAYYDGASTDLVTISNAGVFTTTGGLVIGGTLDVTGAATLKSTLTTGNISAYGAGDNANLTINAKGTGTIGIGNVSSGAVTITPNTTVTGSLGVTGVINPNANITFTNNQNQNINISQSAEDIAGRDLAITAGQAGTTTGAGLAGGALYLAGGTPSTSGNAGDVWIYTDHGGSLVNGGSTHGGDIYIATGNGVGAAGNAGDIIIQPGNKAGTGSDGALLFANDKNQTIKVDQAGADTAGKELTIVSGAAGAPAAGAGLDGGNLTISAGNGSAAASGDTDGGDGGHVIISTGNGAAGSGSGESGDDGDIYLDTSEFITFGGTSSMLGDMRYDMVDGNWSRYVENPTAFNVAINAYDAVKFVDSGDAGYDNSKVGRQVIKEAGDGESHRFAGIANDDGIPIGGVGWIIVYGVVGEDDGGIVGPTDGDANAAAGDGFVLDGTAGAIRKTALATDESCGYFVEKNGASDVWIVFVRAM